MVAVTTGAPRPFALLPVFRLEPFDSFDVDVTSAGGFVVDSLFGIFGAGSPVK